jgi:cell wall-associated NlpC family hydrolase
VASALLGTACRWLAVVTVVCLSVAGCGHAPATPGHALSPAIDPSGNRLVAEIAASMIGTPYQAGSELPAVGFDCSGLVHYSYRLIGMDLPRTVAELQGAVQPVARQHLLVGDLLFFRIGGHVDHVGIYYGDGEFVHAPSSGKAVMRSRLDDDYWRRRLHACGRPRAG